MKNHLTRFGVGGEIFTLLTPHSSLLTPHSSLLTPHSSLLTPHSSLLTPHSSLLTPHSSLSPREQLAGVEDQLRIEGLFDVPHQLQGNRVDFAVDKGTLFAADAMFA